MAPSSCGRLRATEGATPCLCIRQGSLTRFAASHFTPICNESPSLRPIGQRVSSDTAGASATGRAERVSRAGLGWWPLAMVTQAVAARSRRVPLDANELIIQGRVSPHKACLAPGPLQLGLCHTRFILPGGLLADVPGPKGASPAARVAHASGAQIIAQCMIRVRVRRARCDCEAVQSKPSVEPPRLMMKLH